MRQIRDNTLKGAQKDAVIISNAELERIKSTIVIKDRQ
jgi:hypothetical protein